MDLKEIKKRLEQISTSQQEKTDYSKIFWKPATGKQVIRIVPSKFDPAMPFTELKFHYGISKSPMMALSNFGKQDPVEDFIKELKKTSEKENWSLAGKLTPKSRFFAPVIVRGEEDQGVRLWNFGITMYKALLQLASDEEVGDFTDPVNGTDITVTQVAGTPYPETTIMPKRTNSPLSDDPKQVELWLTEQPDPKEVFRLYDYEFIKEQLKNYLEPTQDSSESDSEPGKSSSVKEEKTVEAKKDFTLIKGPKAKGKQVEFDDLFGESE